MIEYNSALVASRIKEVLKAKKISAAKMLTDCGMNKNALYTMQNGYLPRLEAVAQMADYLGVSVDYLLGRSDTEDVKKEAPTGASNIDSLILDYASKMTPKSRQALIKYMEFLVANQNKEDEND